MKKIMSILMLMFMMGSLYANGADGLGEAEGCPGDDCMSCVSDSTLSPDGDGSVVTGAEGADPASSEQ